MDFTPEGRAANETLACSAKGCEARRHGWNILCAAHAQERAEKRAEATRKAVETRRIRHPHRFRPNSGNPNYWQQLAQNVVSKAKALGILPSLASGDYECVDCGGVATEYEHRDYAKPLEVEPVCRGCNLRRGGARYPSAENYSFKRRANSEAA